MAGIHCSRYCSVSDGARKVFISIHAFLMPIS
jgi:hypothetical protein